MWLWHRLAATVPIQPLLCETPYAAGVALKRQKKRRRKKERERGREGGREEGRKEGRKEEKEKNELEVLSWSAV